jgi:hypothetical protein
MNVLVHEILKGLHACTLFLQAVYIYRTNVYFNTDYEDYLHHRTAFLLHLGLLR